MINLEYSPFPCLFAYFAFADSKELVSLQLEEEVSRLQKKLADLQENQVLISKEEKDQINSENEKMVKMWRKRRRMAMDILDAILEGYPKKKKDLFDDIGIETDEDVGVKLPKA